MAAFRGWSLSQMNVAFLFQKVKSATGIQHLGNFCGAKQFWRRMARSRGDGPRGGRPLRSLAWRRWPRYSRLRANQFRQLRVNLFRLLRLNQLRLSQTGLYQTVRLWFEAGATAATARCAAQLPPAERLSEGPGAKSIFGEAVRLQLHPWQQPAGRAGCRSGGQKIATC